MQYCKKCGMPKLECGLERCFCEEETIDNTNEDEDMTRLREAIAELVSSSRYWLAPIADPTDLKDVVIDSGMLPASVFCTGDSRIYDNNGTGWTFIDDDGFQQDVIFMRSPYNR